MAEASCICGLGSRCLPDTNRRRVRWGLRHGHWHEAHLQLGDPWLCHLPGRVPQKSINKEVKKIKNKNIIFSVLFGVVFIYFSFKNLSWNSRKTFDKSPKNVSKMTQKYPQKYRKLIPKPAQNLPKASPKNLKNENSEHDWVTPASAICPGGPPVHLPGGVPQKRIN